MNHPQRIDHQAGLFNAADGTALFEQTWQPRRVSGMVVVVHGIAEHSGRYARLAQDLGAAGYAVTALDLRGHGRSEGLPAYIRSFDTYLDDLALFLERVRGRCAGQPLFLLGHSMGGQIAALYAIERQPELAGLMLSGPSVRIGLSEPRALWGAVRALNIVAPRMPLLKLQATGLSHDETVVQEYVQDPLVYHGGLRVATLLAFRNASQRIERGVERLLLPLLVLHGGSDPIVDPEGSRDLVARVGSSDKTLYIYEGLLHEVLNEHEREHVVADLVAWLDAHR